ncbi:collagen binding domain-containing protein [Nocardioides sp. R-C-SC26]|uniref:MSCRAMM family protein n=1 Tax=Nocardioides sp. R-C-SC26 TaxID=2870414 RepID=UPI001E65A79D|nr:carboxypeptidase-like regulatory domain-containing protein [Nocardioides sp. R-C-SC26]
MLPRQRRLPAAAIVAFAAAIAAALLVIVPTSPASAVERGTVRGAIYQNGDLVGRVKMLWFDRNWTFIGSRMVRGGVYGLTLPVGTYHLQFVDQKPAYDVTKAAPADVTVTIRRGTVQKDVRLTRGAAIGGTVRAGGKIAGGATVIAANTSEQSYTTKANSQGQYAIGGLPPGRYSIFTYDRTKQWVDKSIYLSTVKAKPFRRVNVNLRKRAGTLSIDLLTASDRYKARATVTVVSRKTGQFWTARAAGGRVTIRGLYAGGYDIQLPGWDVWLGGRVRVNATVKPGKVAFGSATLRQRGGWITGTVLDAFAPAYVLPGARVRLYDERGGLRDTAVAGRGGRFMLDGALTTGSYTVVIDAGEMSGGYLGTEPRRCLYTQVKVSNVRLTTGRGTEIGAAYLPPATGQQKCPSPTATPTPTPSPTPTASPTGTATATPTPTATPTTTPTATSAPSVR